MQGVTLQDLTVAVGGRPVGVRRLDLRIGQVRVDSRKVQPGDVFWALPGLQQDGHAFVAAAISAGAVCCVCAVGVDVPNFIPRIEVPNTLAALSIFAAWRRRSVDAMVIGITGSNGKTTTRAMLHAVLSARFQGVQSPENYNNQVGVPLSLLAMEPEHEFAVIELAASHEGEIAGHAALAAPEVGIVTSIAPAHLAEFGSIESIVRAKSELVAAIPESGFVVLNGDDARVSGMASRAACRVITIGQSRDFDVVAADVNATNETLSFQVDGSDFVVRVAGRHHLTSALACVAVGREVGLSDDEIARGLKAFVAVAGRCQVSQVGPWTIIDDTYNANPGSMQAACELIGAWRTTNCKWLVLGDMLSLGSRTAEFHRELGTIAAQARPDGMIAFGEQASAVAQAAVAAGFDRGRIGACHDLTTLFLLLDCWLEPGDVVVVKGSRGMKMEAVIEELKRRAAAPMETSAVYRQAA
jgi:UDP-N-acetylmuramoyl-tripeptide--D-alanyl-D-alanine ligase